MFEKIKLTAAAFRSTSTYKEHGLGNAVVLISASQNGDRGVRHSCDGRNFGGRSHTKQYQSPASGIIRFWRSSHCDERRRNGFDVRQVNLLENVR